MAFFQRGVIARMGAKGFGFIRPADESPDVYFHVADCHLRGTYLEVGDKVLFEINQFSNRGDGKRTACEVRRIGNNAA
jgi:cold shock CspA family protein